MTANIGWPEVKAALKEDQVPQDRCDILNRVFYLKKNQLIKEIENGCFGKCEARVHLIEFQKRGAPHMHLLVWLENFRQTPENIDSIVSSEIPDENSPIYECVITLYIHGPCGNINPHQPCMINHKCSKGFPRAFRNETEVGENSYALY